MSGACVSQYLIGRRVCERIGAVCMIGLHSTPIVRGTVIIIHWEMTIGNYVLLLLENRA